MPDSDSSSEDLVLALQDSCKPNEYDDDEPAILRVQALMQKQTSDRIHEKTTIQKLKTRVGVALVKSLLKRMSENTSPLRKSSGDRKCSFFSDLNK